jgi:hypothetical protein
MPKNTAITTNKEYWLKNGKTDEKNSEKENKYKKINFKRVLNGY